MPRSFDISQLQVADTEIPQLLEACQGSQLLCFDDGEYLFREHEESKEIYLVLRGAFVVEQQNNQLEQEAIASHCNEIDDPCFVGEMAYLGKGARTASVRSSGATFALELTPAHLEVILERFPTFTRILCQQFTARLKEANDILKKLTADHALHTSQYMAEAGEVIISQGEPSDKLYHLAFGTLQWEQDGQIIGGRTDFDFIEPGAYFADMPYPVTVRAKDMCCLVAIEHTPKEAVVRNYPQLILKLYSDSVAATSR